MLKWLHSYLFHGTSCFTKEVETCLFSCLDLLSRYNKLHQISYAEPSLLSNMELSHSHCLPTHYGVRSRVSRKFKHMLAIGLSALNNDLLSLVTLHTLHIQELPLLEKKDVDQ